MYCAYSPIIMLFAGFMCSTAFRRLTEEKESYVELLPVAAIHKHERNDLQPFYYSDIIILKTKR